MPADPAMKASEADLPAHIAACHAFIREAISGREGSQVAEGLALLDGASPWEPTAEAAVEAIKARLAPKLREAVDDLYCGLLDTTQDYLLDNVIYNVRQSIASADRQALNDRCRASDLERENSRLRLALSLCVQRIRSPELSPDANYVLERADAALAAPPADASEASR